MGDKLETVGDGEQQTSSAINVFVTGQPGVGKSRLIINAAKKLPKDVISGFYTVEARNPTTGEKIGYDIGLKRGSSVFLSSSDYTPSLMSMIQSKIEACFVAVNKFDDKKTFAGERAPLSRMRRGCGPKVGKSYFALEDFERVVLPLLQPTPGIKLHIVDEVGRMELQSERFRFALMALLASPLTAVFGSLRAPRFGHDLPFVESIKQREDTATLTLTKSNRDATALKVESILMNIVGSPPFPATVENAKKIEGSSSSEDATETFDPSEFLNSICTAGEGEPQLKRKRLNQFQSDV